MSVDYQVYVGPYAECKVKKLSKTLNVTSCVNNECPNFRARLYGEQPNFCPKCGEEIGSYAMPIQVEEHDKLELAEKFEDDLTYPMGDCMDRLEDTRGVHFWIDNQDQSLGFSFDPRCEYDVREMSPQSVLDQIQRFRKCVKPLEEVYGAGNVKVRWGVINTSN